MGYLLQASDTLIGTRHRNTSTNWEYIALGTTSRDLLKMFFVCIRAKVIDRIKCRIPVFYQLRGGIPISVINKIKG